MNISSVRRDLAAALRPRPAWSGVQLFEYPPGKLATASRWLAFSDHRLTNEDLFLRGEDDAAALLDGVVVVNVSAGASDARWRESEEAAEALLVDLRTYLRGPPRPAIGDHCRLASWTGGASITDSGAIFYRAAFTLEVRIFS